MNNIKNSFSIQDLELLSGVKAHTIRIWEKRYNLLNPKRLNRNIRVYSIFDLQKMLNISVLYNKNYKISKLAKLSDMELATETKTVALEEISNDYQINSLVVALFSFDENLFEEVYEQQIKENTFDHIYINTYLPLLERLGIMWQTESIKPANEHFISNLIYQKIILHSAKIKFKPKTNNHVYILFLPDEEMHEISLIYLNYHLKQKGEKTIYLGRSIPFDDLLHINSQFQNITWVSSFMLDKTDEFKQYFIDQSEKLLMHTNNKCWIVGKIWNEFSKGFENEKISIFSGFQEIIETI